MKPLITSGWAGEDIKKEWKDPVAYEITITKGCPWCLEQIPQEEYFRHPRSCSFYQEFIRNKI